MIMKTEEEIRQRLEELEAEYFELKEKRTEIRNCDDGKCCGPSAFRRKHKLIDIQYDINFGTVQRNLLHWVLGK